jgi:hypothetical protein
MHWSYLLLSIKNYRQLALKKKTLSKGDILMGAGKN